MKYYFIAAFILLPLFSLAQTNFKPGYIVTLKGDTLQGFVDYKDWTRSPKKINFKNSANASTQVYTPANINAFAVTGIEYYKSYYGKISQDRVELGKLLAGIDTTYSIDHVFLRAISAGKNVTLFQNSGADKDRFFIVERNGQPTELVYHAYLSDDQGLTKEFDTKYKQQLQLLRTIYQPDNITLINEIQNTNYDQKGLSKIIIKLNNGVDDLKMISKSKSGARFFIGAGINAGTTSIKNYAGLNETAKSTNTSPMFNIGVDLLFNKNIGKLILRTELSYIINKTRLSSYDGPPSSIFTNIININFDQHILSFSPQLLYNFYNEEKLKLYGGGGLVVNFSAYNNKEAYRNLIIKSPIYFPQLTALNFIGIIKAGTIINKKIDVHVSYQPIYPMNTEQNFRVRFVSYQAGVSYIF